MIYLLDTNTCIIYLKGKNIHLKEKLDSISISEIAVCSIVKSELFYGAMRSAKPESNLKLQQGFLDKFVFTLVFT
jgi:tRNA(fMet)-specific endonuclease VapC